MPQKPLGVAPVLAGSPAFRDLGGAVVADGRRVISGRLFRADALATLEDADRAVVAGLGLRLVCDLRAADERRAAPCFTWLECAPRFLHADMAQGLAASTASTLERLRQGPDPDAAAELMRATYASLPRAAAPLLEQLFAALAAGEWPLLVHCTAGKDRTGFVIAMVLSALGVTEAFIREDYLRGSGRDPLVRDQPASRLLETLLGRELTREESLCLHGVRADYLGAAFAAIERDWGDVHAYLEQAAGVDRRCRLALHEQLLDS